MYGLFFHFGYIIHNLGFWYLGGIFLVVFLLFEFPKSVFNIL